MVFRQPTQLSVCFKIFYSTTALQHYSTTALQHSVVSSNSFSATGDPLKNQCWAMSFEENFDTLSLRNDKNPDGLWHTRYIWDRDVIINNEQQFYIDPDEHGFSPFSIHRGVLSITARPTPRQLRGVVEGQPYVSGVLTTEKTFAQKYGRFDIRAKVPFGQGLWSAFWLLPSFDQWPAGVAVLPEIDHLARTHTATHIAVI